MPATDEKRSTVRGFDGSGVPGTAERPNSRTPERSSGKGLRTRIIAAIWVIAKGAGYDSDRVHEIGSVTLGRTLVDGFGMTTCDAHELGRWLEGVKVAAGVPASSWQRAAGSRQRSRNSASRQPPAASSNIIRLATLESLQLLRTLVEQLRWSTEECNGYFRRACGSPHPRTQVQVQKAIECCKAILARRQQAAGSRQQAAKEGKLGHDS